MTDQKIEEIRALCEVVRYQPGSDGDAAARVALCDMVLVELDRLKAELAACKHMGKLNETAMATKLGAAQASGTFTDGIEAAAKNLEEDAYLLDEYVARRMGEGLPVDAERCEFTANRLRSRAKAIRALSPHAQRECPKCMGNGAVPYGDTGDVCPTCRGSGEVNSNCPPQQNAQRERELALIDYARTKPLEYGHSKSDNNRIAASILEAFNNSRTALTPQGVEVNERPSIKV